MARVQPTKVSHWRTHIPSSWPYRDNESNDLAFVVSLGRHRHLNLTLHSIPHSAGGRAPLEETRKPSGRRNDAMWPMVMNICLNKGVTRESETIVQFSSVAQSCLTLRPHELQHARPPCPSPPLGVHSNSHPSSRWCHPAISSSVVAFSSCPQSLPASESFPMSQLFAWGGQVLEFQLKHQTFQRTLRTDLL